MIQDIIKNLEFPDDIADILPTKFELSRIQMTPTYLKEQYINRGIPDLNRFDKTEFESISDYIKLNNIDIYKASATDGKNTLVENIIDVFFNKIYNVGGKRSYGYNNIETKLRRQVMEYVSTEVPILIVFPGYPFKIMNRLKTSSGKFDSAELFSLMRLKSFANSIQEIYIPGCKILILLDGALYNSIFNITETDVIEYRDQLIKHINILNISDIVIVQDLKTVLLKDDKFVSYIYSANQKILSYWKKHYNSLKVQLLIQSSLSNINLWDYDYSIYEELFGKNKQSANSQIIIQQSQRTAFTYMVIQLAIEEFALYEKLFTQYIRFTVHPKSAQVGIRLTRRNNYLLPWMSCGVVNDGHATCRYFCDLSYKSHKIALIQGFPYPYGFISK